MLIIPTYNERGNIAVLVSRIRKAVGDEPIFFVDDNSPDGTADEIRRIQKSDSSRSLDGASRQRRLWVSVSRCDERNPAEEPGQPCHTV